ncbi:MAG: hypothetical protein GXO90_09805 [FCB group bacterium]|nr:hypothetical protein [FCB group bacterium]
MKSLVIVIALLWTISILASLLVLNGTGYFSRLVPVQTICMIGSLVSVRRFCPPGT